MFESTIVSTRKLFRTLSNMQLRRLDRDLGSVTWFASVAIPDITALSCIADTAAQLFASFDRHVTLRISYLKAML